MRYFDNFQLLKLCYFDEKFSELYQLNDCVTNSKK